VTDEYATSYGLRQDFESAQLILAVGEAKPRECTVTGTAGPDELTGTEGKDVICGLDGDDVIKALGGDDAVTGDGGDDTIFLGEGTDAANGGPGADTVMGEAGDDLLIGDTETDLLDGGTGSDTLIGGDGPDRLVGGDEADDLDGGPGDDVIEADDGDDVLSGGDGDDRLEGMLGADQVSGGEGTDVVNGGEGNDALAGGLGRDLLAGDGGSDVVSGGPSTDVVDGGDEQDRCITGDSASTATSCEDLQVSEGPDAIASMVTTLSAAEGALVPATQAGSGEYVMTGESSVVSAPASTDGAVQVTATTPPAGATAAPITTIGVGLPLQDASAQAVVADDGTVVYPDAQGVASVTVQSLTTGDVQVSTVLPSAAAPDRLRYDVQLPTGALLVPNEASGVDIVLADGTVAGRFHEAWARDANGVPVPTAYEIDGSTLVQVVDLTGPDIAYPVVADPRLTFGWGIYLNMYGWEWKALSVVMKGAIGAASGVACNKITKRVTKGVWGWLVKELCSVAPVSSVTTFFIYVSDNWFGWMGSGSCYQVNLLSRITRTNAKIVRVNARGNCHR
jgi:hypothetical protein